MTTRARSAAALRHGARILGPMEPPPAVVPSPDQALEPDGFVVVAESGDRIHFLDWGGPRWSARDPGDPRAFADGLDLGPGRSPAGWRGRHPALRVDGPARPRALRCPHRGRCLRPARPGRGCRGRRRGIRVACHGRRRRDPRRARRSRVRCDRRRDRRSRARRPLRRPRPRRWRLGSPRGQHRCRCRRVPARHRRAARGHALALGVPARSLAVRPIDLGCGPGTSGPGDGGGDACRPGRAVHAAARAGGLRPRDVHVRPAGDTDRRHRAGRGARGGGRRSGVASQRPDRRSRRPVSPPVARPSSRWRSTMSATT